MTTHRLKSTQMNSEEMIVFDGELIASVKDISVHKPRQLTISLYRNNEGGYVCQRIVQTVIERENDSYEVMLCPDEKSVLKFFGVGEIPQTLYEKSGVELFKTELQNPRYDKELRRV